MANSWFDTRSNQKSTFDPEVDQRGVFDRSFAEDTASSSAVDTYAQGVVGTQSLQRTNRAFARSALIASALLITNVAQPNGVQAAQPDTYVQEIQGARELGQSLKQYTRTAASAQLGYYLTTTDQTSLIASDTYTQEIQGVRALGIAQRAYLQRVIQAGQQFYWNFEDLANGSLSVQPDTYTQDVQGVASLSRATRAWWRIAAGMFRNWETAQDFTVQPDTWTQDIVGTRSLSSQSRQRTQQVGQQSSLWQTLPEDVNGTTPTQPDTWVQDVQGTHELSQAAQAYRLRATQTLLYWNGPEDPPPVPVLDQWTQEVLGTRAIATAQRAYTIRAVQAGQFYWNFGDQTNGSFPVQPDTYTQDVVGTRSLGKFTREFGARARFAQSLSQTTTDVSLVVQPDTWTQDIVGTRSLLQSTRTFFARAVQAQPFYTTTTDGQPDTYQPPTQGVQSLRVVQQGWAQRIGLSRSYWQTTDLSSGPPTLQPDTYQPPVSGLSSMREVARRARGFVQRLVQLLYQTLPEDLTSVAPTVHIVHVVNVVLAQPTVTSEVLTSPTMIDKIQLTQYYPELIYRDGPVFYARMNRFRADIGQPFIAHDEIHGNDGVAPFNASISENAQPGFTNDGDCAVSCSSFRGYAVPDHTAYHFNQQITVEFAYRFPTIGIPFSFTNDGGNTSIFIKFNGQRITWTLSFGGVSSVVIANIASPGSNWVHLACVYDGSSLIIYVNGINVASQSQSGLFDSPAQGFGIVRDYQDTSGWQGWLDEFAVYNYGLSPVKIAAHYAQSAAAKASIFSTPTITGESLEQS